MLAHLPSWAAQDRVFYAWIKGVAAYHDRTGHLPPKYVQYGPGGSQEGPWIWVERCMSNDTEVPDFKEASSDRYSLSFWEGDFWQCYSVPSGKTTMPMSVNGYLKSNAGREILIYETIAFTFALATVLLWPRGQDSRKLSPPAKLCLLGVVIMLAAIIDPGWDNTDDEYVKTAGYLKRYVIVLHHLLGPIFAAYVLFCGGYVLFRLLKRSRKNLTPVPKANIDG
jgi:hypothetical protein